MPAPNPVDQEAKREFIAAYFEERDEKIAFLLTLAEQGREDEAWLLCLVYIDGLANWLNPPSKDSPRNFCQALIKHGGNEPLYSVVLPWWLQKAVPWKSAAKELEARFAAAVATLPPDQGFLPDEFMDAVRPHLSPADLEWLEREVWRGTIANAIYTALRSPGVH